MYFLRKCLALKAHVGVGLCQVVGDGALVAGQGVVFLIKKWFFPLTFPS